MEMYREIRLPSGLVARIEAWAQNMGMDIQDLLVNAVEQYVKWLESTMKTPCEKKIKLPPGSVNLKKGPNGDYTMIFTCPLCGARIFGSRDFVLENARKHLLSHDIHNCNGGLIGGPRVIHEGIILSIVKENPGITTGELYKLYKRACREYGLRVRTYRAFRNYINLLVDEDAIVEIRSYGGRRGNTSKYFTRDSLPSST